MRGSRGALMGLAAAGFVFGLAALALVLASDHDDVAPPFIVLALTLGWAFIGTGLYAQWRRPQQPIGQLMTLTGFAWFLGALSESDNEVVYAVGVAAGGLWVVPFVYLLLAFPSGQIAAGLERKLVWLAYVTVLAQPLVLLFVATPEPDCHSCPDNLLLVSDTHTVELVAQIVFGIAGIVLLAGVAFVLVRRWRRSGAVQRRALSPVLGTGAAVMVVGVLSAIPETLGSKQASDIAEFVVVGLISAVPFAFLLGLLRSSLSRGGAVSALVERFGTVSVRDALAEALGDPDLALAYWLPRPGRYVDADGHPVELPSERAMTTIEHDGVTVAAIVHDPALLEEPDLVRAAGAAAGLALRNERLDAELRARYEELRASQARLVAAGDEARKRIERDLHDGAQQHLVSLALTLRLARTSAQDGTPTAELLDAAIDELKHGLAELRELARGIHPAVLSERGLEPALEGLAARARVPVTVTSELDGRLPAAVETAAYFMVSEALTNVTKYAGASAAEVSVRQVDGHVVIDVRDDGIGGADASCGSGLRGIADRIGALDGLLEVESPPGGGTLLRAELPTGASRPTPAR